MVLISFVVLRVIRCRTPLSICRLEVDIKPATDLHFVRTDVFHKSLFGCCMEVAAFALNKTLIQVCVAWIRDVCSEVPISPVACADTGFWHQ